MCDTVVVADEAHPLIIQISNPDVEALIEERLASGAFKSAEDVVSRALQSYGAQPPTPIAPSDKSIATLFAPLRGENLDFGRNPSTGREVAL